jgi:hypothetical protein
MDGGGSNSSRHYIFKQDLQALVDELGIYIRVAHYPPYTSKWNPIEHRVFPHMTRTLQGTLNRAPYAALAGRIQVRLQLMPVVERERFAELITYALKAVGCQHTLLADSGMESCYDWHHKAYRGRRDAS